MKGKKLQSFLWIAFIEFGESWQSPKIAWLPKTTCNSSGNKYIASCSNTRSTTITISGLMPIAIHHMNRDRIRDSSGNVLFTTAWRNASIVRYGGSLVLLDLVKIHWFQWIQLKPFRESWQLTTDKCNLLIQFSLTSSSCEPFVFLYQWWDEVAWIWDETAHNFNLHQSRLIHLLWSNWIY